MIYEVIKELSKEKGLSINLLEKTLELSKGSLCRIDTNRPSIDRLQRIADYFGVSIDYLMSGKEKNETKKTSLTSKDERDIKKKLDVIMNDIKQNENGPLFYNGEEIDDMSLSLLENAIESAMKQLKIINKEKYNPNKNKK